MDQKTQTIRAKKILEKKKKEKNRKLFDNLLRFSFYLL